MNIKNSVTQEIAEFMAWNLSQQDTSFVLVKTVSGSLLEWKLDICLVTSPTASNTKQTTSPVALLERWIGVVNDLGLRNQINPSLLSETNAAIAQSLPQALTTGSTSTVQGCEHEFVNHIMPGRPQFCKKCGLGMQS